ncbi:MAG: hypothetical protein PUB19_01845 [Lachnospiraceae bacterium]|nr:hypothetical protein [Lachnospiraceae bacterium]
MSKAKKIVAALVVLMLAVTGVFANGVATKAEEGSYSVDFSNLDGEKKASYTVGETTVTAQLPAETTVSGSVATITDSTEITLSNFDPETMEVAVAAEDGFRTTLMVQDNKTKLSDRENQGGGLPSELKFSISAKQPSGDPPGPEGPENTETILDVTVNGVRFTGVTGGSVLKGDFDVNDLTYTIDSVNGVPLINVGNKSGVTDSQGRNPLEIQEMARSESSVTLAWIYHVDDDPANSGAPGFYVMGITIAGEAFEGIQINSGVKPDMYDDTVYTDTIDIGSSTVDNPAKTAVYYGNDAIDLSTVDGAKTVSKIEVVTGTNPKAVTITGTSVKFNSPYYASIPLQVTLSDGTIGYITVDRLGLELGDYGKNGETLHGSQPGTEISSAPGAGEKNIIATFYYDAAQSYSDYNIVANLVFADGSTKTVVVSGYGETACIDPALKGGDYLVWSGKADEGPVSVSVTAVKAGATSGDTFGGACFGAGTGVSKTFR